MKIDFCQNIGKCKFVAYGVFEDNNNDPAITTVYDRAKELYNFKAEVGTHAIVNLDAQCIILAGLGNSKKFDGNAANLAGGKLYNFLNSHKIAECDIAFNLSEELWFNLALGLKLASYRFDKYFTNHKKHTKPSLNTAHFASQYEALYGEIEKIADAVFFTRDIVTEPGNVIYPESYANLIKETLEPFGVNVKIMLPEELKKLGMNMLLGVAQGSANQARVVVMEYMNGDNDAPVAFVGKGVTFDTGGISLKPSQDLDQMKYDMAGSAAVVGTMHVLSSRGAKINAVGVVGLVENMPDGGAQRPGDIVTSMSGKTVEVMDTDAEGRLVLGDVLWYTQDKYRPACMINLATLTGAIMVALGQNTYAGLFSNDDLLAEQLIESGLKVNERFWRMPLGDEYEEMIKSKHADIQNLSNTRGGGASTAAQFLYNFVGETKWAHLDIAPVAWHLKGTPISPAGATAFGVRVLNDFVKENYER